MLTEDQAKTKWCPYAQVITQCETADEFAPAGNRVQVQRGGKTVTFGPVVTAKCLASDCMAWRVAPTGTTTGMEVGAKGEILKPGQPVYGGFCGLAGRPSA